MVLSRGVGELLSEIAFGAALVFGRLALPHPPIRHPEVRAHKRVYERLQRVMARLERWTARL
ncbi:MAG TPA: hypothetical protein VK512_07190 [Xanthobacteraceae bacterium]|nr:hypothetical protein [Xanthobacteraceae bacterium]